MGNNILSDSKYIMGNIIMVCCSNEELVRYEDDKNIKPIMYTFNDEYLDDMDVHRSASEITRIPILDIKPN